MFLDHRATSRRMLEICFEEGEVMVFIWRYKGGPVYLVPSHIQDPRKQTSTSYHNQNGLAWTWQKNRLSAFHWVDDDELQALMSGMVRQTEVSEHIDVVVKPRVVALLDKTSTWEILHPDVLVELTRRWNEITYAWADQGEPGYEAQLTGSSKKT